MSKSGTTSVVTSDGHDVEFRFHVDQGAVDFSDVRVDGIEADACDLPDEWLELMDAQALATSICW